MEAGASAVTVPAGLSARSRAGTPASLPPRPLHARALWESPAPLWAAALGLPELLLCGRKGQAAKGLGFPLAEEAWASKPRPSCSQAAEQRGLSARRPGPGHPPSTHGASRRFRRLI